MYIPMITIIIHINVRISIRYQDINARHTYEYFAYLHVFLTRNKHSLSRLNMTLHNIAGAVLSIINKFLYSNRNAMHILLLAAHKLLFNIVDTVYTRHTYCNIMISFKWHNRWSTQIYQLG